MADTVHLAILNREEEMINRCFRCGLCRTVCPSFGAAGIESTSPRGRVQLARAVLADGMELDDAIRERMLDCLNCMRCAEVCPADVRTDKIVLAARAELAKKGKLDLIKKIVFSTVIKSPVFMSFFAWIASRGQKWFYKSNTLLKVLVPKLAGMGDKKFPAFARKQTIGRWPEVISPETGGKTMRAGYFVGCTTNFLFTDVADAAISVLTRNNVELVIPKGQVCCGIPVYTSGDYNNAKKLAEANFKTFHDLDIECIVTDCALCSAALKHELDELMGVGHFEVPVYDLTEFLVNVIEINRDFGKVPMSVTYHDPCHLLRGQNISREPRELLKMVPGVELTEMQDADNCCGGAGTFSFTHHELSRNIGKQKVENIRNTGAEYVSTPCPSCKMQIDDLINHAGMNVLTIHPVQVLDMAYRAGAQKKAGNHLCCSLSSKT
ncbi:(Fe-S)-binding protein [Candidatus Latescibacterota bacterium]